MMKHLLPSLRIISLQVSGVINCLVMRKMIVRMMIVMVLMMPLSI